MGRCANGRNLLQITEYKAVLNSQGDYRVTHPNIKNAADSFHDFLLQSING